MKRKIFDFGYYVQCLRRVRIVGIAVAILCVAISALIPIYHMISMSSVDFYEANSFSLMTRTLAGNQLAVPAMVFSYLMPVFVFLMFSYLNRRSESDFYHAVPLSRVCVYMGSVAAVLSWAWGILALSYLVSGALWTLDPQAVFSWGELFLQLFYACLNAALLSGIATVAVCLMGTMATSVLASGVLLFSWRFILYLVLLAIEDRVAIVKGEELLGAYLTPSFLLPMGLITTECNVSGKVLVYAALITVLAFSLGGVFYARRRSEVAGRAVPGRWVQHLIRTLLCLPTALLLTYQLMGGTDGGTAMVLFVLTVLIFYLYELLTTKRVRSMLKATPYLLAVPVACAMFFGVVTATEQAVWHEDISSDRITAVSFYSVPRTDFGSYDAVVVQKALIEDDRAAALVAVGLERAQTLDREGDFYAVSATPAPSYSSVHASAYFQRCWMNIRLRGGMTVVRQLLLTEPEYYSLIACIREEVGVMPIPPREEVKTVGFYLFGAHTYCELSGDDIGRLLSVARDEWATLDEAAQKAFGNRSWKQRDDQIELQMTVRREGQKYNEGFYYYVDPIAMPRTFAVLMDAIANQQPSKERVEEMLGALAKATDGEMHLFLRESGGAETEYVFSMLGDEVHEILSFIAAHMTFEADTRPTEDATLVHLSVDLYWDATGDGSYYTGFSENMLMPLFLSRDEAFALITLCSKGASGVTK